MPTPNTKTLTAVTGRYETAYGMLGKPARAKLREILERDHEISVPTFYRYLQRNVIPLLPKRVMIMELNTLLKDIGYEYQETV